MAKRFLVVGLGHFGSWVAHALHEKGHDVVALDRDEDRVDRYADYVTRGIAGDATDTALLRHLGIDGADAAIISTGDDLASAILATMALKELGLEDIYVKVPSTRAARALDAFDVTETIFPEREAAYRLAQRIATKTVLNYIPVAPGYSIQEIGIPDAWLGKTLRDLALPQRHGIQVVALHDLLTDRVSVVPDPEEPLKESDVAVIVGRDEKLRELIAGSASA
ncbi:MAG: potassium channel family protein [Gemmatimonadota bacterium]